jgi:hypothetical protein
MLLTAYSLGSPENHIVDIAIDQYDRLWARGPGSLTLISQ